jgi:hypothetical protein
VYDSGCDDIVVCCFTRVDDLFTGEAETCVACPAGSYAAGKLITTA